MKKLGGGIILLIILGSIVFLWLIKAPIMSSYLTSRMKIPISIGSMSMWPSQTIMKNFKVPNPRGYSLPYAFKAERTEIDYQLKHIFGDPCIIDKIEIDNVLMTIIVTDSTGAKNNWAKLGSKIPDEPNTREIIIHHLILTNMKIEIRGLEGLGVASQTKTIDRMEFDEIDSKQGFPTKELISKIFEGAGMQKYIQELFNPENIIEKVTNPLPFDVFGSK